MTPAQRGAQTRRARQQAERLRWIRERTAEVRGELLEAFEGARRAMLAFCASDPSGLTWDTLLALQCAMSPLSDKLGFLESFKAQMADLGGSAPAETIHDDLANVIDLARRRPRGEP